MERLEGRVGVVTGAASGIGLAISEAFLDEGMRVVTTDVNDVPLGGQATRLVGPERDVRPVVADVADPEAVAGQLAVEVFGELNVAVNNAGIVHGGTGCRRSSTSPPTSRPDLAVPRHPRGATRPLTSENVGSLPDLDVDVENGRALARGRP